MTALDTWTDAALKLAARYERTHRIQHLDRAITLFSRVVRAGADSEPDRARHLDNLGVALLTRYEATADVAALEQALASSRAATATAFAGHPDHALHLSNLSNTALAWFDETHDRAVLDEVALSNLANCLLARARNDDDDDVTAAIRYGAEAVRSLPCGTQDWARAAATHSTALTRRWQITGLDRDAAAALEQWLAVVRSPAVAVAVRVAAARDAAALAHRWGRPRIALRAARSAVALVPLLAWRGLTWRSRTGRLAQWQDLGVDVAALSVGSPADAAVLVEHGRGVLWAQFLDTRHDLDEVARRAPELAERLFRIRTQLDTGFAPST